MTISQIWQGEGQHAKTVIVFVHGYTGNKETWYDWATALKLAKRPETAYVVEYDSVADSVSAWGKTLAAILAKNFDQGNVRLLLIGHSMGAPVIRSAFLEALKEEAKWTSRERHDFVFLAPADTGCKKLVEVQGLPSGLTARALAVLAGFVRYRMRHDMAFQDLSGQTGALAQLQAQADKFKPSLAIFQADTDIVVNTRPFRRGDPVIVIPHSNHSTVTKCLTPHDPIVIEVLRILDGQFVARPAEVSSWERMVRLFFERSGALAAYELLVVGKQFFASDELKIDQQVIVMRNHTTEAVKQFSEQTCRDLLDRFVDFLAMTELAIASELCSLATVTATVDLVGLIKNAPFQRYLEYYPNRLVERLFRRVSQPDPLVLHGSALPASVQLFLDTTEAIANNPRIQLLLRLLDGFGFRGINIYSVLDRLDGSEHAQGAAEDALADAILGLGDYMEALEWLFVDGQLDAFEKDVILFHSYWISRLGDHEKRLRLIQERLRTEIPPVNPIHRTFDRCLELIDLVRKLNLTR